MPPPRQRPQLKRPSFGVCSERHLLPSHTRDIFYLWYAYPDPADLRIPNTLMLSTFPGSDGTIHFWDKDARTRLKSMHTFPSHPRRSLTSLPFPKAFDAAPGPISATAFSRNGNFFAYSISYDWAKGHSGMTAGHPNKLMLHLCKDEEVKKRPRK